MTKQPTYEELVHEVFRLKKTEAALKKSEQRYRYAQRIGHVGNWEYDLETKLFWGSEEAKRIYGFDPGDETFTTEKIENCILDRERVHQALRDLIKQDKPYDLKFAIRPITGQESKVIRSIAELVKNDSGQPVKVIGVIQDISKHQQVEECLRKSEERYRELFENAPFPYQSLDEQGRFLEVNKRWLDQLGYSREDVIGKSFGDFLHPDWQNHFRENFPRFKSIGEVLGMEFQLRQKDGTHIWVSFDGKIKRDHAGKFLQTHCIFSDISEQKRLQEKVHQQHEALNQSRKLESVGRLAGGVAHDFNNMLSIILGYTELALERLEPSDPLYAEMEAIYEAGRRSAHLTKQLLAFARKQTISPKVLDLNENIGSMITMLRHLIGENIDFGWMPGNQLWSVKMDPSQIDQILANLCINARDAITDIGKVTIETKNVTFDQDYCAEHTEFLPGEYVMLAVSDDGCGIAPEALNQIFEPFFTTKKTGQGTGLGLATVYGIVKQNNGFINVYSEIEKGTTIKVYLSRYGEQAVKPHSAAPEILQQSQGETVLLVEDNASILKLGKRILENLGYKVLSTTKSKDAQKIAEEYDGQINLLITDVIMPEMNGQELSEHLQRLYPMLKILFMSGYTANVIAHRGVLDEGINFISKPFSPKEIAVKIRKILDQN